VQGRRDIAGFRCCRFAWSARSRLVHSKGPSMDGHRPRRYPDMRRADLHSVRPTLSLRDAPSGMAKMAGDGRFPGSRVIAGTTFPGKQPSGFWCRLSAHSCGGSSGFAETREPPCLPRPVFPLSPVRRQDTVGWGFNQTETPSSQSPSSGRARACCRDGLGVILSPPMDYTAGHDERDRH
jgi:hypothetical protein